MIVTMVPPKAGRLASGSYGAKSPIAGSVFGDRPRAHVAPGPGGLKMDNDRTATVYVSPLSDYHNVSTQRVDPPASVFYTKLVSPIGDAPSIQPHERGTFFGRKIRPTNDMVFGGSKSSPSDTAFHAMPEKEVPVVALKSATDGSKVSAPSFKSNHNLWSDPNNSFIKGRSTPVNPNSIGVGRWGTVKRGAVS